MRASLMVVLMRSACALDDGLAVTPPMGWRSWNQFGKDIDQSMMEAQFDALADRSRMVDGVPTSLADVGYEHASIDDGWQLYNSGPDGRGYHNASGYPIVNTSRFPDLAAMTAKARSLGVKAGWYENNEGSGGTGTYDGVINATFDFGFEGIKMDRCGHTGNAGTLSSMLNATGKHILQENNNAKASRNKAGDVVCPMHFFRTGIDIRPTYGSVLNGMRSTRKFNEGGLTGPGCWAHADMLVVGVTSPQPPGAKHHCGTPETCFLNITEMRTNFGAWCIISNPLILAMDLRNGTMLDRVWTIITNREAIAVNQQWIGDSGRLHSNSSKLVRIPNCGSGSSCQHAQWMVWTKALQPVPGKAESMAAVFLVNNDDKELNVSTSLAGVHGLGPCGDEGCSVRSIWEQQDLPFAHKVSALLEPHDSAFFIVGSSQPAAPPPTLALV